MSGGSVGLQARARARPSPRGVTGSPGVVGGVALFAGLGGCLLWLVALAGPWRLASGLLEVRSHLARAERKLAGGALKEARYETAAAGAAARRAEAGLGSPALLEVAGLVPDVGEALAEVDHLVGAARHSAAAATSIFGAVEGSQKGPTKVVAPDLERPGHLKVRLGRVERAAGLVSRARAEVRAARAELGAIALGALPRRAAHMVSAGLAEARRTDRLLADAEGGFAILPGFLGAEEPRTYLLAMQNSAEQRGTGGAILQYSFLRLDDGRQKLLTASTVYDVDRDRETLDIPLPDDAWYVAAIEDAQRFGNSNWSPDWPLSTRVMLDYARATERARPGVQFPNDVDGVIGVDPIAVQELMPGVGRYRIRAGHRMTTRTIVAFVLYRAYASYPIPQVRRVVLHQIVDGFYEGMLDPASPSALVRGMGRALARKHVQVWLEDRDEQAFMERMNWDGAIEPSGRDDYLYVVEQNVGGNKLDYFDSNSITMDVAIAGGDARVSTRASVRNGVFLPQPRWALGNSGPFHQPMINVYVPRRARLRGWDVAPPPPLPHPAPAIGSGGRPAENLERNKKVWTATVRIPPQQRGAVSFDYVVPDVVQERAARRVYRLVVQHQPKVRPEQLRVRLRLPRGASSVRAPGWAARGNVLAWEGPLVADMALEVSWLRRGP
jgi:hypothetical protein